MDRSKRLLRELVVAIRQTISAKEYAEKLAFEAMLRGMKKSSHTVVSINICEDRAIL